MSHVQVAFGAILTSLLSPDFASLPYLPKKMPPRPHTQCSYFKALDQLSIRSISAGTPRYAKPVKGVLPGSVQLLWYARTTCLVVTGTRTSHVTHMYFVRCHKTLRSVLDCCLHKVAQKYTEVETKISIASSIHFGPISGPTTAWGLKFNTNSSWLNLS